MLFQIPNDLLPTNSCFPAFLPPSLNYIRRNKLSSVPIENPPCRYFKRKYCVIPLQGAFPARLTMHRPSRSSSGDEFIAPMIIGPACDCLKRQGRLIEKLSHCLCSQQTPPLRLSYSCKHDRYNFSARL
jgi:hypothetical protein